MQNFFGLQNGMFCCFNTWQVNTPRASCHMSRHHFRRHQGQDRVRLLLHYVQFLQLSWINSCWCRISILCTKLSLPEPTAFDDNYYRCMKKGEERSTVRMWGGNFYPKAETLNCGGLGPSEAAAPWGKTLKQLNKEGRNSELRLWPKWIKYIICTGWALLYSLEINQNKVNKLLSYAQLYN